MYRTILSPEELHPYVGDEGWAIVDARFHLPEPDKGERDYLEGHIPGAVYAHLDRDLSGPLTGNNGRHPLPGVDQMAGRFGRWGIDGDVQVVVYDTVSGQMAARLWWMLRYLGHDAVAVLDGGLQSWEPAGYELASGREESSPRSFVPRVRASMRIDVEELTRPSGLEDNLLIDARAPERYRGEVEPLDPVAGHIPGARNHGTALNLGEDGRLLPADELRTKLDVAIGDRPADEVVSYCGSGVTACHNLMAMEIAGIREARLYPGSWSEWCADERRPIEKG